MADRHLIAFTANYPLTARLDPGMIDSLFEGVNAFVNKHPHVIVAWSALDLSYWPWRSKPFRLHIHGILVATEEIRSAKLAPTWRAIVPVDHGDKDEAIVDVGPIHEYGGLRRWLWYCLKPLSEKNRWDLATGEEKAQVEETLYRRHLNRQYPHSWQEIEWELGRAGVARSGTGYDRDLLSDAEWERIWPFLLDTQPENGGRPAMDRRTVLEGILRYLYRGGRWKDLPAKHGKPETVSSQWTRWKREGTWSEVVQRLDQPPPQR
ncbi:MAG: transposase [Salinibacter sp.]